MTRPRSLQPGEWSSMTYGERGAYAAEMDAWERTPEGAAEKAAREEKRRAAWEAQRLALVADMLRDQTDPGSRLGLPSRAVELALAGDLQETVALAAVRGAADMLVLSGGVGTGKTVAAVAWLAEYIRDPAQWSAFGDDYQSAPYYRGGSLVWTTAADLARMDHYSQEAFDRVAKARRLVVDDLGAEYSDGKGFFGSLLDELVDARYSGLRPTVITTNLDAPAFAARYGARVVDRVREAGRFVGCGSESLRKRPG
ncbi:MAG: ATP-binding protein [Deltaproteobacteria bacterium]|nr:ATP-binding protein [Deltaproteobacteria bacterium]